MALFKGKGEKLSRATAIVAELNQKNKTKEPPVDPSQNTGPTTPQEPVREPEPSKEPAVQTAEPPVVEPVVKEPVEPVTPAQGAQEPAEPAQPEPPKAPEPKAPEITDELILSALGEKLGRKIESFDDLTRKEELDPEIAQLVEWKEKTGLSLSKWSDYNKDFSQMGDLDVAREILARKYPNFTQEELDYSLKNYVFDPESDEESDRIKKSIALKQFAQDGRKELEANRLQLIEQAQKAPGLTPEQQQALERAQKIQQDLASQKQADQVYSEKITQAAQTLDAIDLELSDELKIKFNLPGEVKNALPKYADKMPHWYNPDGSINHSSVVKDIAIATQFNSIVKEVFEQGVNVGKEGMIKKRDNITIDQIPQTQVTTEKKGNIDKVVENITGGNQKKRLRFGKVNN